MSTIIQMRCIDQVLVLDSTPVIATGGVEEDFLQVEFCSKWDGLTKTAVFWNSQNEAVHVLLDKDNRCAIPAEVLLDDGPLTIGLYGVSSTGEQRSSGVVRYNVIEGAIKRATVPQNPTTDLYTQLLAAYADAMAAVDGVVEPVKAAVEQVKTAAHSVGMLPEEETDLLAWARKQKSTVWGYVSKEKVTDGLPVNLSGYVQVTVSGHAGWVAEYFVPTTGATYYNSTVAGEWLGWKCVALDSHTHTPASIGAVPNTRKVNGKPLSGDINLVAGDISGAVPNTRKVNGKPLSGDVALQAEDVGAWAEFAPVGTDCNDDATAANTRIFIKKYNGNTLNSPYKAGLTTYQNGYYITYAFSSTHSTQVAVCGPSMFFRSNSNIEGTFTFGEWTKNSASGHTHTASDVGAVPTTRKVNNKPLSSDVNLSASDVGAVPTARTVNGKALSGDVSLAVGDISGAVPTARTVNGKPLSSDVTLTAADVGAARVATGNYTGTGSGTAGKTLTFPFSPTLVYIAPEQQDAATNAGILAINGMTYAYNTNTSGNNVDFKTALSWGAKSITLSCTDVKDGEIVHLYTAEMNKKAVNYRYVAIG